MNDCTKQLIVELEWIEKSLGKVERNLKELRDVKIYTIGTSNRKNGFQFYCNDSNGKRRYIKEKNHDEVRKVLQKNYYETVKKALSVQKNRIEKFIKCYDLASITDVYEKTCEAKKKFIIPIISSDEEYIAGWLEENTGGKNPFPETGRYPTERGEYVRSKSEKILADLFYRYNIPYAYESAFEMDNGSIMYPDFVLLNVRKRKTIYWEHFGLVGDAEYSIRTLEKLIKYENNGIDIGDTLLFSMESDLSSLNISMIERKIQKHLL